MHHLMISLQMYKIVITDYFKKQLKSLVKKDAKLRENLKDELVGFSKKKSISIGSGVYKIRIAAQGRGKSAGYRAYLFVMEVQGILAPVCIYAKNQKENLTFEELTRHVNKSKEELIQHT